MPGPRFCKKRATPESPAVGLTSSTSLSPLGKKATIEACSMVFLKQTLSIAAYEGVRTAISTGATADDVEQVCDQVLLDRGVNGGTVSIVPNNVAGLTLGDLVDVTVSAPCDGNMVLPNMFYRDRTLSATASMMTEL